MKKEELVAARLPAPLVSELKKIEDVEQSDRSTVVRKLLSRAVSEWRREHAAKRYSSGRVSLERAAAEAGVSVREMMQYLKENKISGQYDLDDLDEDLKNYYSAL